MNHFTVNPSTKLTGTVSVPGDKSISHRALMLSAIANGVSTIDGFLAGEDCLATLEAFRAMGVTIEGPSNNQVIVKGVGKHGLLEAPHAFDFGNSGTSIRLLSGLLAAQQFKSTLTGDASLLKRPMERITKPLTMMGANISTHNGCPPILINKTNSLKAISYELPVSSAQVKSSVLLAALYADGTTKITEPAVTRDHTERMLQSFAYPIKQANSSIELKGGGELTATNIQVPSDISSAAFFMVGASIAPGSEVLIKDLGINPTRTGVIDILKLMGADITINNIRQFGFEPVADVLIKYAPLKGIDIPVELVSRTIDEFPAIFIAAACADGVTRLRGAEELRHKESDRLSAMADGLKLLGIDVEIFPDGLRINGGEFTGGDSNDNDDDGQVNGTVIDSKGDHRIAMAFAMAALKCKHPLTIKNTNNVATSFPNFVTLAAEIGLRINE